jgi:hypothetical protein
MAANRKVNNTTTRSPSWRLSAFDKLQLNFIAYNSKTREQLRKHNASGMSRIISTNKQNKIKAYSTYYTYIYKSDTTMEKCKYLVI